MPKPIFVVGLPKSIDDKHLYAARESLNKFMEGYHVLLFKRVDEDHSYQAFYEKDFNEVKFEDLKKIIEDSTNPK